jgi:hypothetical protein
MAEACISFNYFREMQSLSFAIRKTFAAMRENSAICIKDRLSDAKQPRDCMQRIHVVEIARIVMNALRTGISMAPNVNAAPHSFDRVA